jgi:hypothetical protein
MAIKITTWRPDTCECEIEYEWDDNGVDENKVHTLKKFNKVCQAHSSNQSGYGSVLTENQNKNKGVTKIVELLNLKEEDAQKVLWKIDKDTREVSYNFSELVNKPTALQKAALQTELTKISGKLKVV